MKNKKSNLFIIVLVGLMLLGVQGCSKYPDNEGITLVSKADRVTNVWKVDNYKLNDVDYTSLLAGYTETFTKEGSFSYQWAILGGTGTWAFQNKDAEIRITGINNQTSRTLFILKLEENAFWYYYMDGNDKKVFHMVPQ